MLGIIYAVILMEFLYSVCSSMTTLSDVFPLYLPPPPPPPPHTHPHTHTHCYSSVCKSIKSWLDSDPQHVAVVHCKGGKGRTGCVIAAFMHYSEICQRLVPLPTHPTHTTHIGTPTHTKHTLAHIGTYAHTHVFVHMCHGRACTCVVPKLNALTCTLTRVSNFLPYLT